MQVCERAAWGVHGSASVCCPDDVIAPLLAYIVALMCIVLLLEYNDPLTI